MTRKSNPIREIDQDIARLEAIMSYRSDIKRTFKERDAVFANQQAEIQKERDRLLREYESADDVIADCRRRIVAAYHRKSLLRLKGSAATSKYMGMSETDKAKLKLRALQAQMEELQKQIADE